MTRVEMEKLIRSIVRKLQLEYPGTEREDLEAQGWLIVTEKIDGYSKRRGASLSTYLYTQVDGELRHYIERVILRGLYMNGRRVGVKVLPDTGKPDATEARIMLQEMVSLETGVHKDVLKCMIAGARQSEVAGILGLSKQRVSVILKGIRERYED